MPRLTGRTRYRRTWFTRRLVLQVEVLVIHNDLPDIETFAELEWRDATVEDFDASPPGMFSHPPMPYPGQKPIAA